MRVRYKPWAEDYLKDHPELVDMDGQHAGKMTEWFDKTQPIHIEIGSGMGQFITTLAAQNPHINYISMEREKSIVYKVLDKVKEMGLTNLKIICNDAIELNEYFKDGEVSRIYLNFSDPWVKALDQPADLHALACGAEAFKHDHDRNIQALALSLQLAQPAFQDRHLFLIFFFCHLFGQIDFFQHILSSCIIM